MPGVAVVQDKPWKGIPNAIVYQKGGWTLHLLRGAGRHGEVLGGHPRVLPPLSRRQRFHRRFPEGHGRGLRRRTSAGSSASGSIAPGLAGRRRAVGRTTPQRRRSRSSSTQTQPGDAYRLPLEVAIGAQIERIEMTAKQQRFEIAAEQAPASVTLDPNTWMLMDANLEKR